MLSISGSYSYGMFQPKFPRIKGVIGPKGQDFVDLCCGHFKGDIDEKTIFIQDFCKNNKVSYRIDQSGNYIFSINNTEVGYFVAYGYESGNKLGIDDMIKLCEGKLQNIQDIKPQNAILQPKK